jgi:CP family cyanate transporter-like MFS transporter
MAPEVRQTTRWGFVISLLIVSLNFRAPFLSLAPVIGTVRADLGLGDVQVGLLTTLPVLCFGATAPIAAAFARRVGFDRALLVALVVIGLGVVGRATGAWTALVLASVAIGLGITVGNVVAPAIIHRDVAPRQAALVTSTYTGVMNVGAMLATVTVSPLTVALGWRKATASWVAVVLLALMVWCLAIRTSSRVARPAAPTGPTRGAMSKAPLAAGCRTARGWLLAIAFAGQVSAFYGLAAWLPQILVDRAGVTAARAGTETSLFQVLAIVGALLVSTALRRWSYAAAAQAAAYCWIACPVLLLLRPGLHLLATVLGGLAQGAGLTVLFVLLVHLADSAYRAAEYSAFVQGVGYTVSAAAPLLVGVVHSATDGWAWPLALIVAYLLVFAACQVSASRRL